MHKSGGQLQYVESGHCLLSRRYTEYICTLWTLITQRTGMNWVCTTFGSAHKFSRCILTARGLFSRGTVHSQHATGPTGCRALHGAPISQHRCIRRWSSRRGLRASAVQPSSAEASRGQSLARNTSYRYGRGWDAMTAQVSRIIHCSTASRLGIESTPAMRRPVWDIRVSRIKLN